MFGHDSRLWFPLASYSTKPTREREGYDTITRSLDPLQHRVTSSHKASTFSSRTTFTWETSTFTWETYHEHAPIVCEVNDCPHWRDGLARPAAASSYAFVICIACECYLWFQVDYAQTCCMEHRHTGCDTSLLVWGILLLQNRTSDSVEAVGSRMDSSCCPFPLLLYKSSHNPSKHSRDSRGKERARRERACSFFNTNDSFDLHNRKIIDSGGPFNWSIQIQPYNGHRTHSFDFQFIQGQ